MIGWVRCIEARGLPVLTDVLLGIICRLRRIQSSRYEIGLQMQGNTITETTYTSLVRNVRITVTFNG